MPRHDLRFTSKIRVKIRQRGQRSWVELRVISFNNPNKPFIGCSGVCSAVSFSVLRPCGRMRKQKTSKKKLSLVSILTTNYKSVFLLSVCVQLFLLERLTWLMCLFRLNTVSWILICRLSDESVGLLQVQLMQKQLCIRVKLLWGEF